MHDLGRAKPRSNHAIYVAAWGLNGAGTRQVGSAPMRHLALGTERPLLPGAVTGQTGNKGLRAVFFQSLTSAGAQRQGVPRATGTGNEDSVGSAVLDSSQGSVWLLWVAAAPPITAKLTRFPAD